MVEQGNRLEIRLICFKTLGKKIGVVEVTWNTVLFSVY